jgi:hypothetical protein
MTFTKDDLIQPCSACEGTGSVSGAVPRAVPQSYTKFG